MSKFISLPDVFSIMATPTTCDTYSLASARCELTMPAPSAMSYGEWEEVKEWLALVMRRTDRLMRERAERAEREKAKADAERALHAGQEVEPKGGEG